LIYRYLKYMYDRKRSEEKINFFVNTAHDLRTPLTLISAPLFELKERLPASDGWNKQLLDIATNNLYKLNKLTSQLLDFQKSYERNDYLFISEEDIGNVVSEKVNSWTPAAINKHISLKFTTASQKINAWIDTDKFDKILDNLFSNAIKYTEDHGAITVKLEAYEKYWSISVTDNGIGIPKPALKKLFTRFYRTGNAVNSQEPGSGLGLLLIKSYVEKMGGTITVSSVENQGSEFCIRFRYGKGHLKQAYIMDESDLSLQEKKENINIEEGVNHKQFKVLIVEDNNDLREYMKMSLRHYYKIFESENGADAWKHIPAINPDLIISDINMPEMDGISLCGKVKNTFEYSHIPIILLTAIAEENTMIESLKTGADDFISKPFDMKLLKIKIDSILNNRKLMRMKFLDFKKSETVTTDTENPMDEMFLKKATEIIEAHIMDSDFSINKFSKELGLSRTLLFKKFNTITGYTPNDFIRIYRLNKAIQLFREKKYLISEVANLTGFVDPSYFATCFKKFYGKTPKQFIEEEID